MGVPLFEVQEEVNTISALADDQLLLAFSGDTK